MSESNNLPTAAEQDDNQQPATSGDVQVTSASSGEVSPKNLEATDQPGPLERRTGQSSGERDIHSEAIHEYLADRIYDSNSAFVREFLQNAETACIRACKTLIRHHPKYGEEHLTQDFWIDSRTGETLARADDKQTVLAEYDIKTDHVTSIEVPRKLEDIVAAARDLGYEPTIEIDVNHDEREIIWQDNGIGMTSYEVDEAFNVTGNSGVRIEGDTGGRMGMGSLTFKNVTGRKGGMNVSTRTRLPDAPDYDYEGIKFYAYLGGWDELDNSDIEDDFKGTRFEIPAQESFNLSNMKDWVEKYTSGLRVPVLYQEHRNGSTPVKEEYGDMDFVKKFDEPPVVIDQPGEFTAVAGPNVNVNGRDTDDTWLVSMPIDRNSRGTISSFWSVAIQIHDEQGRIITGPHRGYYHQDGKVYETQAKETKVGDLDSDDVPLPEPTADRDRLERNTANKRFIQHVQSKVKSRELQEVAEVAERLNVANPHDVIRGDENAWNLFRKMLSYHGPYNVMDDRGRFQNFVNDLDELPDYDDETAEAIFDLFDEVSIAPEGRNRGAKKRHRSSMKIGKMLAIEDPDEVYMAASTSGAFLGRKKVVENTHDDVKCIVVSSAGKYEPFQRKYGFKKLKEVPREQSDDHDYEVPDSVHGTPDTTSTSNTSSNSDDGGGVGSNILKFRTDSSDKGIDYRRKVDSVRERLEKGRNLSGHQFVVMFPRGGANISDHYWVSNYAAITSASKAELEELHDFDRVFTYEEFMEFSKNTVIATEEGGYTVEDLVDLTDDRLIVIARADSKERKLLLKEHDHEAARLRRMFCQDIKKNRAGSMHGNSVDDKEPLFAVADSKTARRAAAAFHDLLPIRTDSHIVGLKWAYHSPTKTRFSWYQLYGNEETYKRKARTPSWDNESDIYDWLPRDLDGTKGQLFMGFHDIGVDPTDLNSEQIRELIGTVDKTEADIDWQEISESDDD